MKNRDKLAVLLTRAQPFTLGHEAMVKEMLRNSDHICIVIGSADKHDTKRNPFKASIRFYQVCNILKKYTNKAKEEIKYIDNDYLTFKSDKVTIFTLADWENENNITTLHQWGSYLYYNIVSRTGAKSIVFYSGETKEKLQDWFCEDIKQNVEYRMFNRVDILDGISATKAREELLRIYHSDESYIYGDIFEYLSHDIDLDKYGILHMSSKIRQVSMKE